MIDTERELAELARLHDDILRERAAGLHEAAESAKTMLVRREEALARLRLQVALLKSSLHSRRAAPIPAPPVPAPAVRAPAPAAAAPAPARVVVGPIPTEEAALDSARVKAASPARMGLQTLAPYLAIVACALFFEFGGARKAREIVRADAGLARPAATIVASGHAAAKGAPVVAEEDRSQEALLLVHEWTLPGDERTLGDRLGDALDLPGTPPAWSVERTGERGYRVTYRAGTGAHPYSFEADLDSRVVWPTPETQELLAPRIAALRDAPR